MTASALLEKSVYHSERRRQDKSYVADFTIFIPHD
jgi:hypothetical protein